MQEKQVRGDWQGAVSALAEAATAGTNGGNELTPIIGLYVKRQPEGWGEYGCNPKGTADEIEERLDELLNERFPNGGWGGTGVTLPYGMDEEYCFDCQVFDYKQTGPLTLALLEFVLGEFSVMNGIEMHTFWSS